MEITTNGSVYSASKTFYNGLEQRDEEKYRIKQRLDRFTRFVDSIHNGDLVLFCWDLSRMHQDLSPYILLNQQQRTDLNQEIKTVGKERIHSYILDHRVNDRLVCVFLKVIPSCTHIRKD